MTFTTAITTCLKKYVTFSGRASRPEYWWFFLFGILVSSVAGILDGMLFGAGPVVETTSQTTESGSSASATISSEGGPLAELASLVLFLPSLAVGWRRMHDIGKSGLFLLFPLLVAVGVWTMLLFGFGLADMASGKLDSLLTGATLLLLIPAAIIAILSPLLVLWWLTRPSQPGTNDYGPNPHEVTP